MSQYNQWHNPSMQLCPLLNTMSKVNFPIYSVFALGGHFSPEFKNSLKPVCYHDSLGLLIRRDSFNCLVIFNNTKGQHSAQPWHHTGLSVFALKFCSLVVRNGKSSRVL